MDTAAHNEFSLIRQYFSQGFPHNPLSVLEVGDDCSVITPPAEQQLCQSLDSFVSAVHFPADAPADLIAERCLRAATSDLAAMGATPYGFHLGLTLPQADSQWLQAFSQGLKNAANDMQLSLLGGDTTKGPVLVLSFSVFGFTPSGQALLRSGAKVGDEVWVSDVIGRAALALPEVLKAPSDFRGYSRHYYFPTIQLELGQKLRQLATSCMDISDGLIQDASHLAKASGVSLALDAAAIPTPVAVNEPTWINCVTGGDDYQLLFTAPAGAHQQLLNLSLEHSGLCCIGKVISSTAQAVMLQHHQEIFSLPSQTGFLHFS